MVHWCTHYLLSTLILPPSLPHAFSLCLVFLSFTNVIHHHQSVIATAPSSSPSVLIGISLVGDVSGVLLTDLAEGYARVAGGELVGGVDLGVAGGAEEGGVMTAVEGGGVRLARSLEAMAGDGRQRGEVVTRGGERSRSIGGDSEER